MEKGIVKSTDSFKQSIPKSVYEELEKEMKEIESK